MNLRRVYEWAVPAIGAGTVLALSAVATDLPDPVAIHWGSGGQPDGSGSIVLVTVLLAALVAGLGALFLGMADRMPDRRLARGVVATAHGLVGFLVALHVFTVRANEGAASWEQAGTLGGGDLLLVLLAGLPLAAVAWWVSGDRTGTPATELPIETASRLPADEEADRGGLVWSSTTRANTLIWVLLLAIGTNIAIALLLPADLWLVAGVPGLLLGVLLVLFVQARVTIGPAGVRIGLGPWMWPGARIALEDVEDVTVELVEPMRYGGWGYRLLPGVRAVVVRKGEGLRISRRGGADVVVTVDDAATGADVLRHLAARGSTV